MTQVCSFEEFKTLSENTEYVAVFEEIKCFDKKAVSIYRALCEKFKEEGSIFERTEKETGYHKAYLSFEPLKTLSIPYGDNPSPLESLKKFYHSFSCKTRKDVQKKITHSLGFIAYDIVHTFEKIADHHLLPSSFPLALFRVYETSLALDTKAETLLVSVIVKIDPKIPLESLYNQAMKKIQDLIHTLEAYEEHSPSLETHPLPTIEVDTADAEFENMVKQAQTFIQRGDAFQIVISRSFKRSYTVSPITIYNALYDNEMPFMFYIPSDEGIILGASPELLVEVKNEKMTVNPIAGTRGKRSKEDEEKNREDLLSDEKELAEHMMLVDLARNDVGSIAIPGSVSVDELLKVRHYSNISHITSSVSGKLKPDCDAFDALKAAFPAGTLSGAPKISAMKIIASLEKSPRGIYGGAICRFNLDNDFESAIAIRTATLQNGIATIRTGAGIVFDSLPHKEAEETRQKARAILSAFYKGHGESDADFD